jgi:hypothetical protein
MEFRYRFNPSFRWDTSNATTKKQESHKRGAAQASRILWETRPTTVDAFVDALFRAEGLEDDTRRTLRTAVKSQTHQFIAARGAL